jgi:hypothetical protein
MADKSDQPKFKHIRYRKHHGRDNTLEEITGNEKKRGKGNIPFSLILWKLYAKGGVVILAIFVYWNRIAQSTVYRF